MTITTIAQATSKKSVIAFIMKETGLSKARAKKAIRELEESQLLIFPPTGGMSLRVSQEAI